MQLQSVSARFTLAAWSWNKITHGFEQFWDSNKDMQKAQFFVIATFAKILSSEMIIFRGGRWKVLLIVKRLKWVILFTCEGKKCIF